MTCFLLDRISWVTEAALERNFRTLKERWLYALDFTQIHSLEEFNESLARYIRQHNTTVHSSTGKTPMDRYLETKDDDEFRV